MALSLRLGNTEFFCGNAGLFCGNIGLLVFWHKRADLFKKKKSFHGFINEYVMEYP